ncbi:ABC-type dipeptide/oligopeptide/nickel transport system ATPase component [Microbacterium sp. BE35]|uniref:ABC transporter ATP-binding protein n=1 Tax=Microbacterium sp. BE35 TaxID=2817773 RepID=UPI00285F0C38|nr:ABC transporter ATP-binding protein [Microbacterium sp. BE35]MDR7191082.1 ABC-type dipeptide/oligopeptide/nickel transport system ATPase component [Microbacterium sp. BE35]
MTPPVLEITGLTVSVPDSTRTDGGRGALTLVDGVSLTLERGERVALVGESGSGKSMTAKAVMRLDPTVDLAGSIRVAGHEVIGAPERTVRRLRGSAVSMVFQDPMTALNPVLTIGDQVTEPLRLRGVPRREARARAIAMLDRLGVPSAASRMDAYPYEFSGGMRQRVVMAAALIGGPDVLIADEPTTALDVRVQEQVLDLLEEQSRELGLAVLLITHDLAIVAGFAHRVAVMRHGRIVEDRTVDDLYAAPQHPYTRGLLASIPSVDDDPTARLRTVDDVMKEDAALAASATALEVRR